MDWKKIWHITSKVLDYVLPAGISVMLVVWLFNKVNFHEVIHVIRTECNFWWVALMLILTTLSHMIRGIRWGIQLRAVGVPRMTVTKESVSIFGAFALNLVFPRLGEVWRCVYISRTEKESLSTVVGTDIGDRGSDAVVVIFLTLLSLIVARPELLRFLEDYTVGKDILHALDDKLMWLGIAAFIGIFWAVCHFMREFSWVKKLDGSLNEIWQGFRVLFTMHGRLMYVILTIGIWSCYFFEMYVMFQAFPFTRLLDGLPHSAWGLIPALVVFVFGSYSMAIPSNGGLGPWNLAVMFALSLYGISDTQGASFTMVMWGCQAAWLVVEGLFSAAYVITQRKKADSKINSGTAAGSKKQITT